MASLTTPSPSLATPSSAPVPTSTSRTTPLPSPRLGPRPPFGVGSVVWTVSPGVRVRSKPRVSSDSVKYEPLLPKGSVLELLDGPVAGSGYWWYRIELLDKTLRGGRTTGWLGAGDHDGTPWIGYLDGLSGPDTEPVPEYEGPTPFLALKGTEEYTSDGASYTAYHLSVVNWRDFPAELFEPSADPEPCGAGSSRTRTWVDIIDTDTERRLGGFCGLSEPEDLGGLAFSVPIETAPPSAVYVVVWDRLTDTTVESNSVSLAG